MNFGFCASKTDKCDLVKRKHLLCSPFLPARFVRGQPNSKRPRSQTQPECFVARGRRLDPRARLRRQSAGGTDKAECRRRAAARGFKRSRFPGQNRVAENGDGRVRTARDEASVDAIDMRRRVVDQRCESTKHWRAQDASAEPDRLTPGGYLANRALAMGPYVNGAECIERQSAERGSPPDHRTASRLVVGKVIVLASPGARR